MATMIRDIGDRMVQALDDLKNGTITPDQARAMAGVAMGRLLNYSKEMQHDAR